MLSDKLSPSYDRSSVKESLLIDKNVGSILLRSFDNGALARLVTYWIKEIYKIMTKSCSFKLLEPSATRSNILIIENHQMCKYYLDDVIKSFI